MSRRLLNSARSLRQDWADGGKLLQKTKISRSKFDKQLPKWIKSWIKRNTTPSSNSKNVSTYKKVNGHKIKVVTRWRTKSLDAMFERCKLEAPITFGAYESTFSKSYFFANIPSYVKLKKKQDALCPIHHTGYAYHTELLEKREMWHNNCQCTCAYCRPSGCAHGANPRGKGDCSKFTCSRCKSIKCPMEHNASLTEWSCPIQHSRKGGGLYWENVAERGTRSDFMNKMRVEMKVFEEHDRHCEWHKKHMNS